MTPFGLSVIIPVFNAERFLEKAIQSVLIQPEVTEIIIIDDGSSDNSLGISKRFQEIDSRIQIYQHNNKQNQGISASRNLGVEKASGDLISFLDADDYYLPGRFHQDLTILQEKAWVDGVYNALGSHLYDQKESKRLNCSLTTITYPVVPDKLFEEMAPIGKAGYFHCDTLTVRKRLFLEIGLFDEHLEVGEDTQMWMKMALKKKLVGGIIDQPVAIRGVHDKNTTKDRNKSINYVYPMFVSLLGWALNNEIRKNRLHIIYNHLYRSYYRYVLLSEEKALGKDLKLLKDLLSKKSLNCHLLFHHFYQYHYRAKRRQQ